MDYDTASKLQDEMFDAINDDNALKKLKQYNAQRGVSALYLREGGITISIKIYRLWNQSGLDEKNIVDGDKIQKVKIGNLYGYWKRFTYPDYPYSDMTVKPLIKEGYRLLWEKSGIAYSVSKVGGSNINLDESLKIANDFMKVN